MLVVEIIVLICRVNYEGAQSSSSAQTVGAKKILKAYERIFLGCKYLNSNIITG